MTKSSFPALLIAPLLLAVCLFPGQGLLAYWLPGLSGRATIDPSLTIFDIPLHMSIPIDLILVPALFVILYSTAILIFTSRSHLPLGQALKKRLSAIAISVLIILLCIAIGALLSFILQRYLPDRIRSGLKTMAANADLHLPRSGYPTIHLSGDTFTLLGLIIGLVLAIIRMGKAPHIRRRIIPLTREQRMTPYQRMLQERQTTRTTPDAPHRYEPRHGLCRTEPLATLQPQAVAYRPLA